MMKMVILAMMMIMAIVCGDDDDDDYGEDYTSSYHQTNTAFHFDNDHADNDDENDSCRGKKVVDCRPRLNPCTVLGLRV